MSNIQLNTSNTESAASVKCVKVCQNRTCRKQGAALVLAAFQKSIPKEVTVTATSCLGQCGNGPMVLVLPDEVWYSGVHPSEVSQVIKQHLQEGQPVTQMLYHRFHPHK
jgi:(2Fe-2S) ferredoxin